MAVHPLTEARLPYSTRHARPSASTARQVVRFAAIGVASTGVYFALYWLLRAAAPALVANLIAQLVTAVANTAANRRLTFGVRGPHMLARDHIGGLAALAVALTVSTASLAALHAVTPEPSRVTELIVLGSANLPATVIRFILLRVWMFHPRRGPGRILVLNRETSP